MIGILTTSCQLQRREQEKGEGEGKEIGVEIT